MEVSGVCLNLEMCRCIFFCSLWAVKKFWGKLVVVFSRGESRNIYALVFCLPRGILR